MSRCGTCGQRAKEDQRVKAPRRKAQQLWNWFADKDIDPYGSQVDYSQKLTEMRDEAETLDAVALKTEQVLIEICESEKESSD